MALRIIYEGDEEVAKSHLPAAQNLMFKVRAFVAASGAGTYSSSLVLDADSYAYALKIGDAEVIYIFSAPRHEYVPVEPITTPVIPLFMSGVVKKALIRTDYIPQPDGSDKQVPKLEFFRPNAPTAKRMGVNESPTSPFVANERLAVKPSASYFNDYRIDLYQDSPDKTVPRSTSQYFYIRSSNYTGRMQDLVQVVLGMGHIPEHSIIETDKKTREEMIKEGIQLVYDCRYFRSHGLCTGDDGALWIVEISNINGVIAMRLPVYPKSAHLAESSHRDIAAAVDAFKGMPTGQGFPTGKRLAAAIKEGSILQLATRQDIGEVFTCQPYFSLCGWAFNTLGTEAHNTGWFYHDDGMIRSRHYMFNLHIGALKKNRQPNEPIAVASAKLRMVSEGRIMHYSEKFPPPFKTYEPLMNGLVSFGMLPTRAEPDPYDLRVVCDATMFVYFADDQLKKVNYYYDRKDQTLPGSVDNYEPCMYVGQWKRTTTYGPTFVPAMFYTTDVDDREAIEATRTLTSVVGVDLGWFGPYISDHVDDLHYAWIYRNKFYKVTTTSVTETGRYLSSGIVIPEGMREGYVYAVRRGVQNSSTTISIENKQLTDPNQYTSYRLLYPSELAKGDGCYTSQRKIKYAFYNDNGDCARDLVDNGAWLNTCMVIPEERNPPLLGTTSTTTGGGTNEFTTVTQYVGNDMAQLPMNQPGDWPTWQYPTPDNNDFYQQMRSFHTGRLGEFHAMWDTVLNPLPDSGQHKSVGRLIKDVSDSNVRERLNFIGVL